jgi:hypothetical protein
MHSPQSSEVPTPSQDRHAELVAAFADQHPELREVIEIFGVANAAYDAVGVLSEPTQTASNLTLAS